MNPEFELLQTSWLACSQRVDKLKYSLLRNKFAHHYPEMSKARIARLNLLPIEATLVIETFSAIEKYLKNKQFL
jgi:hypothetical protein